MGLVSDILPDQDWQPRRLSGLPDTVGPTAVAMDSEFYRLRHAGGFLTFAVLAAAVVAEGLLRLSGVPVPGWSGLLLSGAGMLAYGLAIRADRQRRRDVGLTWFWDLGGLTWGLLRASALTFVCFVGLLVLLAVTGMLDHWIALDRAGHRLPEVSVGLAFGLMLGLNAARHLKNWCGYGRATGLLP